MKKRNDSRKKQPQHGSGAVRYSILPGKTGALQLQLDFRLTRVPETYYYADALSISVDQEMGTAILAFGRTITEGGLRDRIDIVMPAVSLLIGFLNSMAPIEPTVDKQLEFRGTLYANLIFVSTGGAEACLDFYYLPVRDLHFAKTVVGSEINLQPIIRIPTSPVLLKHMVNLCRELAGGLQSREPRRRPERAKIS